MSAGQLTTRTASRVALSAHEHGGAAGLVLPGSTACRLSLSRPHLHSSVQRRGVKGFQSLAAQQPVAWSRQAHPWGDLLCLSGLATRLALRCVRPFVRQKGRLHAPR